MLQTKSERRESERKSRDKAEARRLADDAAKAAIIEALPEDFAYSFLHAGKLYGTVGSIDVGSSHVYSSIGSRHATMEELRKALIQFPPVARVLHRVKGGCTTFCSLAWVEANPDKFEPESWEYINGVTFSMDHMDQTSTVSWETDLDPDPEAGEGLRVRMGVKLSPHKAPIGRAMEVNYYGNSGTVASVERVRPTVRTTPKGGESPLDQHIRFASGSREYPGRLTCYWREHSARNIDDLASRREDADIFWRIFAGRADISEAIVEKGEA